MTEETQDTNTSPIPNPVLDQIAFQLGRHMIGQTLAEYTAGMNGSEAASLRKKLTDTENEVERAHAQIRQMEQSSTPSVIKDK